MKTTRKVTFTTDADFYEELKELAAEKGVSVDTLINACLKQAVVGEKVFRFALEAGKEEKPESE